MELITSQYNPLQAYSSHASDIEKAKYSFSTTTSTKSTIDDIDDAIEIHFDDVGLYSNDDDNIDASDSVPCPKSIHFGAVAWGCGFYVGVLKAFEKRWGADYHTKLESVHGDSAGVIFALGVALGVSADFLDTLYRTVSEKCHAEGFFNNKNAIDSAIDKLLSEPDAYNKVQGRLSVGVTEFPLNHVRYSEWTDNENLRHCMHGSMYLPLYCEPVKPINGKHVVDGGFSFSGKELAHGNDTLFIGIDPTADITGAMSLWTMAFPMVSTKYNAAVSMGYEALMSWSGEMKDKITGRLKNPAGGLMWPLKWLSAAINAVSVLIKLPGVILNSILDSWSAWWGARERVIVLSS